MDEIRLLGTEDIEVRVAQTNVYNNNGSSSVKVTLLLYKNARVDMKILDELFGPMGWKRSHRLIGDRLYCQVEVWDSDKKEWISKEDVGVESNTEAEKGQASDSFKRACVNWGIGRELYTAPRIVVELTDREYTKDQQGKLRVWASFSVKSITYDAKTRTITSLEIQDRNGNVRFSMDETPAKKTTGTSTAVKARRKAADREQKEEEYKPLPDADYWKIVEAFANGKKTKTGGNYRDTWIEVTHAGPEQIAKFDNDVANIMYASNL